MIPQSFIQDLLNRVDIVDVVERHVKLKRAGANYVACCPFHGEKTPSFTVSQSKQFYHCFGCSAHGTAIGFIMEYNGAGFVDAVKELAQSVGMKVPEEARSERAQRRAEEGDDLHGVLLQAAQFYRTQLKAAPHAVDYLKGRGLSGEIAKRFGIGYAPDGWQGLAAAFPDYHAKALVTAGLVKSGEEGKRYDVFRDRIMFPIVDVRGNVIGFGGRVLGDGEPKYLNSPETPVFEKGRELYGLYQARRAIRDAGRVIVVEGYMDVVALAQSGIEYAVATLGTATTPTHVQKLLRQTDEIVFCFDGDAAGRRAAWRALENSLGQLVDGKQVGFLFLPQGEDPDSYVRKQGKAVFEALLDKAVPLSQFLLQELAKQGDLSVAEGRANLIHLAKPLLKQIEAAGLRLQIVKALAEVSRLAPDEVERLCELRALAKRSSSVPARHDRAPMLSPEKRLLRLLLDRPQLAEKISDEKRLLLDSNPEYQPAAELVRILKTGALASVAAILEATRLSKYYQLYEEAVADTLMGMDDEQTTDAVVGGIFAQLELRQVQGEYERLSAKGACDETERQRFQQVSRRLAELKGGAAVIMSPGASGA
jgi:DNA primase